MTKKMKIIFTVSLVLNVLLIGTASGLAYRHVNESHWHQVKQSLAPETRHMMARVFQKNRKDIKLEVQKAKSSKKKLLKILNAEDFNQKKFDAEVKKLQKVQSKIRKQKLISMGELAADLPLSERQKLMVLFDRTLSGPSKHHGKKRHKLAPKPQRRPE